MNRDANRLYQLNDSDEKQLWNEAALIFDSSALLDYYTVPKPARENIYAKVLTPHKSRFWIPGHVQFEFLKNREKVIVKPVNEQYKPLKETNLRKIEDGIKSIETQISDLQNKIKDPGNHPHLNGEDISSFQTKLKELKESYKEFNEAISSKIDVAVKEIEDLHNNDDVLSAFENLLTVGRDYNFGEVYGITEEGKHRFQFKIPPGYMDLESKDKVGTQIFGDLIIWKQILEFSKQEKKPIIFICDDLKEDWCYLNKRSGNEKRIEMPREELIKEMFDFSGQRFWMYNLSQFLYLANKYWGTTIAESDIQNVAVAIARKTQPIVELDLIYQSSGRSNMGYSPKNPVVMEDGQPVINIGFAISPIIFWHLDWNYEIRVHNNSSFPVFNIKIESVGQSHFDHLEELRPVNNIKPYEFESLNANFEFGIEGVHTEADEILKQRIPNNLNGLLLKITYYDANRQEYISFMKIEDNKLSNFSNPSE
jgi:ASC-1-like (ASCH) protein